ncbi:MAG: tail fiber domain-containing protein [Bacteroidales bacterium]|nr:tail fiber domain-containing protein [Bacteroidales bacterium]
MKKFIVTLGLVLSLSGVSALQAQMRLYNANLVKFGNVNTAPTLSSGLEINMPNFLFKGNSVKFTIYGHTIQFTGYSVAANSAANNTKIVGDGIVYPPVTQAAAIAMTVPKNNLQIGSKDQPLHSLYSTTLYSSSGGVSTFSDRRYKTNIQDLSPALDKVMRLRPVKFDYLDEKDNPNSLDSNRMNRVGLIAQELAEVVPEAVQWLWPDDIYTVDYTTLIPFLIKSMQEQQAQIEALRSELQTLKTTR